MKIAVISDIHGNFEALKSVFEDIETEQVDKIINLGDFINYGPQSEEVTNFLLENEVLSILGNHENAILYDETLRKFQVHSRLSFMITKEQLSDNSINYIKTLKYFYKEDDCYYVHGIPPDNCSDYIFKLDENDVKEIFSTYKEKVFFVGHTHVQGMYFLNRDFLCKQKMIPDHEHRIDLDKKIIINIGSVGQPRGHDKDAHYVIYNTEEHSVKMKIVKYDIEKTIQLLNKYRYPQINSEILKNY